MATRAMDPTLARQAVLIAALLCAVPSAAVGVFALRDAPDSVRTERSGFERSSDAPGFTKEVSLGSTAAPWSKTARSRSHSSAVGERGVSGSAEARADVREGVEADAAETLDGTPAAETAAAAAGAPSEKYAERKRRFEEELAAGQNRADLAATVQARLASQRMPFAESDSKREVRCTNSVCEVLVGVKSPLGSAMAVATNPFMADAVHATEPTEPGAPGSLPWKRANLRVLIDTTTLGAEGSVPPAEADGGVSPAPPETAPVVSPGAAPEAESPAADASEGHGPPVEPAPAEAPASEP